MVDKTITESDIWADIDAAFALPEREPGDIDIAQLMTHYGLSRTGSNSRMEALKRTGNWEILIVKDDISGNGRRKIVRKVK